MLFRSPGKYLVKLQKGDKEYTDTLTLIADANTIHTDNDRKLGFETTMKLFNLSEQLAYKVYQLDVMTDSSVNYLKKVPKLKKEIDPIISGLDALKKTLVQTTGDNYIKTPEPQLKEKLGSLYSQVAGYNGKPSAAQLLNLALLEKSYAESIGKLDVLKGKLTEDLLPKFVKYKLPEIGFQSFDNFKLMD